LTRPGRSRAQRGPPRRCVPPCLDRALTLQAGALSVDAFASHAVMGRDALARIAASSIGKVIVLDSLPLSAADLQACPKLEVVDIASLVGALIADLHLATD